MTSKAPCDERVLILLPTVRDGERTRKALDESGIACIVCQDLNHLCEKIIAGAGVALITEEALAADRHDRLAGALRAQPAWSDFPLIIVTRTRAKRQPSPFRESMNVSLIERPVRLRSLLSVVRAALRSRLHQYQVRDHLTQRERQASVLRDKEEHLQFALAAGRLGSWDLDLATGQMECSALFKENVGLPADQPLSYPVLLELLHPDDRERVQTAIGRALEQRAAYDVEYRASWPDGTTRWLLMRGRAQYGADGAPLCMSGVLLDITDRRRNEEALRDADRKKDDFLALLAHELRNPLAPIRTGLQVLRMARDHEVRDRSQQMMERQLGHMVRLIDDLLDISRINRNKMELRMAPVLLADAVSSAVETARPAIEAAGHELTLKLPPEPVLLNADLTRLAQVFANLLTNSAKYTERGGRIALRADRSDAEVVVKVQDSGIGIPADALPTIFDMFAQVDRPVERSTGGLGIGLALVKGLVEMHGGTVSATSGGPDRGSEFTVRLPALPVSAAAAVGPAAADPDLPSGPKRRILVVDDNRDSADSMADMLRLCGNEVAIAHDGLEAVEQAEAFGPHVILMDVGMPRLNGLDAARRIRALSTGKAIIIIALTGWGQDHDRLRSRQAGCDGHLVKPVTLADLQRLISDSMPASDAHRDGAEIRGARKDLKA